ncbi:uncharacterized protein LOC130963001 [Arachis stenosperma]|uniref:uncharacterized protein LOC130963001 n=1 Tax=Arachis stenosperma TaxID=217475 RepID=UPI0025ABDFBA|nr:uncharacterized protein LOC130963001 [Arachis stenosperma]
MTLATFLKVHLATFKVASNPIDANNWIQTMERALQAQLVPEEQWVEFGTYQLQGEAQYWWQGTRRILQPDGSVFLWEVFRIEFYKKYFSNSARNAKSSERYSELRCPNRDQSISELVNKSRVAEDCLRKATSDKSDQRVFVRRDQGRNFAPRGQDFKRGSYTPQPHLGQNNFQRFNNNNIEGRGIGKQAQTPPNDLTCKRCGKYHPNTPCRAGLGVCYYCGGVRHLSWNCPEKKKNQEARKAQHQGRMFTMTTDGAGSIDTPIRGNHELVIDIFDCLA